MNVALAFLFTLATLAAPNVFGGDPSWFPLISCDQAWSGKDKAKFDFARDKDFASYQVRLHQEKVLPRTSCYKEWTLLVYMAADNDLEPYALWDLHDMEGGFATGNYAGSTLKSDLVVEADTFGRTGIRRIQMFQTPDPFTAIKNKDAFVARSIRDVRSPVVQLLKETKPRTDHEKALEDFLDWGMKAYPAKRYAVIVWGHGQGWSSGAGNTRGRFGGLAFNDSTEDYLSIPSLSRALRNATALTLEGERRIDLYASDACLMQMAEVAFEIAPAARFIVGSAQVQSYLGLPYRQLMYELNTGRFGESRELVGNQDEAFLLARLLPSLASKSLDPSHGQQGRADKESAKTFTMSSLSTDTLQTQLSPSLRYLGSRLKLYLQEDPFRKGDLRALIKRTPNFMGGSRELGSFLGLLRLQIEEEASQSAQGLSHISKTAIEAIDLVRGALQLTTVSSVFGSRYQTSENPFYLLGFKGVGVWVPQTPREYQERFEDFAHSRFYKENAEWAQWLSALFEN